jgi:hypothetical protein
MTKRIAAVLAMATLSSGQCLAQKAARESDTDTELSKEIENPVTRRITLPLRYEADFLDVLTRPPKRPSRSTRQWCRSD